MTEVYIGQRKESYIEMVEKCVKEHRVVGIFLTSDTIDVQKLTVNPIKTFGETMYKTILMALVTWLFNP